MNTQRAANGWLGAMLLLAVPGALVIFWAFAQMQGAEAGRRNSGEQGARALRLVSGLYAAQADQRAYLLTGEPAYLLSYLKAQDVLPQALGSMSGYQTSQASQPHLDAAMPLLLAGLQALGRSIELRRRDTTATTALAPADQGDKSIDGLRTEMAALLAIEDQSQSRFVATYSSNLQRVYWGAAGLSALALLFAFYLVASLRRNRQQRLGQVLHQETARQQAAQQLAVQRASNADLQQANLSLRGSQNQLAVTLSSMGEAVIATDAKGRITLLNKVAQRVSGWTAEEARSRKIDDLFELVHRDTRAAVANPVEAVLRTGVTQSLSNHTLLISHSGREFDIADSCSPICDPDGRVVGTVLVFRDVTKEVVARLALNDGSALLQSAIFNSANFSSIATDSKGVIQIFNVGAERMLGYTAAEVLNQITPADISDPQEVIARAQALSAELDTPIAPGFEALVFKASRGIEDIYELTYIRKDGSRFPAVVSVTALRDAADNIIGYLLIGTDNTARMAVEAERLRLDQVLQDKNVELQLARVEADKANQAKSDFLSSMSHELRSPLNAILGFAQLMETSVPHLSAPQKASIGHILRAGWYLLDLINEVLDLSLIESGKLSLSIEPIALPELLEDCHSLIQPLADKRGIRLHFPVIAGVPFVAGDRTRVKQVLINLLSNAIKYNRACGIVKVSCVAMPLEILRICVQDSGEGLAAEQIAQLFQPFNRLGQQDGTGEGTGIGLVVSKRLVELMGGEIGMTSEVGVGSMFWIDLTLSAAPQLAPPQPQPNAALRTTATATTVATTAIATTHVSLANGEQRTLLYIEDNQANMDLVEQLIARRPNMRLLCAGDGMHGVLMARQLMPDLVLLDINLPGISGLQALKMLQNDSRTCHIPVLALSANTLPSDIRCGLEAGFFRYLTKPVRVSEFMEALDRGLLLVDETQHAQPVS